MRKYFVASKKTTKLFNDVSGKFDIEVTALVACKFESFFYNSKEEAISLIDMMAKEYDDNGYYLQSVDEELDTNGGNLGLWKVPYRLPNGSQVIYALVNESGEVESCRELKIF